MDTTQATVLGWSGWIVPLLLVVVLLVRGRLVPRADGPDRSPEDPRQD